MKKVGLVLMLALAFSACNQATNENAAEGTNMEAPIEELAKAEYSCPMKCQGDTTYAEPGKCPVCKMDLTLVGEHHEGMEEMHEQMNEEPK